MAKTSNRTILVTGATGKQGGAALRHLRARGFLVRALTRDPSKPSARALAGTGVELVRGDLEDAASITRALDGVHGVFAVQTPYEAGPEAEERQGKTLASAAQRAQVSHYVYSSVGSADRNTGIPHFDSKFRVEEHIRGLGLSYTILRPVFFMENLLGLTGMIAGGTLTLPLPVDRKLQMIAVDDIGAIAALALEHSGKWQGRAVDIASDELSTADVAATLSRLTGREIRAAEAPIDDYERQAGRDLGLMWRWFQNVGYNVDIRALRSEYAGLTSFERWASRQNWQASQSAG
ncbi:MAG TPA: NmrA/HSCARG family protein [Bryobacteraceae bacterium]|nr:NmrA/HSCARG family protein [Bryobacteraceae bacterium]